jgi:tetratricopeptide (TPR) repeat protein
VLPIYRAEAARYAGRQSIDRLAQNLNPALNEYRDTLNTASLAFSEATRLAPSNAQAWADRAYVTELWSHVAPARMNELGKESETYAREALDRSLDVPEFWIRRGVSLDMQGRWNEGGESFRKALELGRFSAVNWYYLAYHQSLSSVPKEEVIISIENCLRLDPAHRAALALAQRIKADK